MNWEMEKTFLILINNAYRMGEFHLALAKSLKSKGANVLLAFTDKLSVHTESIDIKGFKHYIFSEFFKSHYNECHIKDKYQNVNINKTYYSEYDRNIIFGKTKFKGNEYYQSLMANLINFFDLIYTKNKVDFCLYESISNSFAYIAYETGKVNNVQYCGYAGSRLKNRFELYTEEFGSITIFKKTFDTISFEDLPQPEKDEVKMYLSKYKTNILPSYHPQKTALDWNFSLFKKYFDKKKINLIKGSILYILKEREFIKFSYQIENPLIELYRAFIKQIKKQYITRVANKYFDKPRTEDKYFLYPQHFKPEASTSVLARHFCSDITVIENIAFNLPFGCYLYVKEHFVNYGRMSLSYYKALKNIPNVKLIGCEENTKTLIDHSLGIITLTSTVGFEALLSAKPVFVFGNVFYECHPNCRKLNSFETLEQQLKDLSVDNNPEINLRFISAYRKISFEGNIYYFLGEKGYSTENFTEPFIKAINERFH